MRYAKQKINVRVVIPAHHIGFRRYERLSEADCAPYAELRAAASFKP